MAKAALIVFVALVATGALLRGWSWWVRQQALSSLPAEGIRLQARGVSLRVLVRGTRVLPGMKSGANRTTGDLAMTADRFVLASARGKLADITLGRGHLLTSARSPGPGRLVIEGDVPHPTGAPGLYRVEVMLDDAVAWAEALGPFVRPPDGERPDFAVKPPS